MENKHDFTYEANIKLGTGNASEFFCVKLPDEFWEQEVDVKELEFLTPFEAQLTTSSGIINCLIYVTKNKSIYNSVGINITNTKVGKKILDTFLAPKNYNMTEIPHTSALTKAFNFNSRQSKEDFFKDKI